MAIGGLECRLWSDAHPLLAPAGDSYADFVSPLERGQDDDPGADVVRVRLAEEPRPCFDGDLIFRSSAPWAVFARGEARGIVEDDGSPVPLYAVHLDPRAKDVLVQCSERLCWPGPPRALRSPLHYPLDQILFMHLLGRRGFILHAACALIDGRAVALTGVSGAGKTTLTRLAHERRAWRLLSDDRCVVRVSRAGVSAWGTPWPGEGQIALAASGPLDWLLFLEQGEENDVRELTEGEALRRLLRTTSVPWYDAAALADTLAACEQAVRRVRSAVLVFRPDAGAVDAVERLVAASGSPAPGPVRPPRRPRHG